MNNAEVLIAADAVHSVYPGLPVDFYTTRSRKRDYMEPRQILMVILVDVFRYTLSNAGLVCGGRDHTTVIHARKSVENLTYTYKAFKQKYDSITSKVLDQVQNPVKTLQEAEVETAILMEAELKS